VLTNPNLRTCYKHFRMWPNTFLVLCNNLKHNGFLRSSQYVKITEQRLLHTVSVYCKMTCKAICRLGKTIIQPTQTMKPHPAVARNGDFYPWFSVSNACPFYLSLANIFKIIAITYHTILTNNTFTAEMYRCY
jgi:hypothetical protein